MMFHVNFPVNGSECVSYFQSMSDSDIVMEYLLLQSLFEAYDNFIDSLSFIDSSLLSFFDFLEAYLMQEICSRFCRIHTSVPVPRYPIS